MKASDLAAIQARCDAATLGPWEPVEGRFDVIAPNETNTGLDRYHVCDTSGRDYDQMRANKVFIAHARSDIPALLAEVQRLRGLVEAAYKEGWNEGVGDGHPLANSPGSEKRWKDSMAFDALKDV